MKIDELVSVIRFDMAASSKTALAGVDKAIGGITDRMKGLGIVSAITSGAFAAFSINAAKDATNLNNLSFSLGINRREIQALGAVYQKLGGNMKNFTSDADAFYRMTGRNLDAERLMSLSEEFSKMQEDEAKVKGRGAGFSDDMIRLLQKGPSEIRRMTDEALKYNATSDQALEDLDKFNKKWTEATSTISKIAGEIQGAFAKPLTEALEYAQPHLNAFADWLENNDDKVATFATALAAVGAVTIPATLISSIGSLAAAIGGGAGVGGGLIGAGTKLAAVFGTGGLVVVAIGATIYALDELGERIDKITSKNLSAIDAKIAAGSQKAQELLNRSATTMPETSEVAETRIDEIKAAGDEIKKTLMGDVIDAGINSWGASWAKILKGDLSGGFNELAIGRERAAGLASPLQALSAARDQAILNTPIEDKQQMSQYARDPKLRRDLQNMGYGPQNLTDKILGQDDSRLRDYSAFGIAILGSSGKRYRDILQESRDEEIAAELGKAQLKSPSIAGGNGPKELDADSLAVNRLRGNIGGNPSAFTVNNNNTTIYMVEPPTPNAGLQKISGGASFQPTTM